MFVWIKNMGPGSDVGKVFKILSGTEEVGEQQSNKVEEAWSLDSLIGEDKLKLVGALRPGKAVRTQFLDVWTGADKRTLEIQLNFVAFRNPRQEVFLPIKILQRWAAPSRTSLDGKVLEKVKALNEGIANKLQGVMFTLQQPPIVQVKVGESYKHPLVFIENGLITSLRPSWKPPFDPHGYPIHAEIQLTINDLDITEQRMYRVNTSAAGFDEHSVSEGLTDLTNFSLTDKKSNRLSLTQERNVIRSGAARRGGLEQIERNKGMVIRHR